MGAVTSRTKRGASAGTGASRWWKLVVSCGTSTRCRCATAASTAWWFFATTSMDLRE